MTSTSQPNVLITGAGRGLGLALARALLSRGWRVVVDARRAGHLAAALPGAFVVPGDVTDPGHREALAAVVSAPGRLDLLVNNASHLDLLAAVAGTALVGRAYAEAVRSGYRWHEFGDSCLLLP